MSDIFGYFLSPSSLFLSVSDGGRRTDPWITAHHITAEGQRQGKILSKL
jgi:hypothetical protein